MNKLIKYIWLLAACLPVNLFAQGLELPQTPEEYGAAVKEMLTRTNKESAMATGATFDVVWNSLTLDAKKKIMAAGMDTRERKYPIYPHLSEYFRSIALAVEKEGVDPGTLIDYLNMTDKVRADFDKAKYLRYLRTMAIFFEFHALHNSPRNRLYPVNDNYVFEYIGEPEGAYADTDSSYLDPYYYDTSYYSDDYYSDPNYQDEIYDPYDPDYVDPYAQQEEYVAEPVDPYAEIDFMKPEVIIPEPYGPIIRFEQVSLNIATYYDSVFIENTSGFFSLDDNSFTGEGGTFDWSVAGLEPVYVDLDKYTFDANKPEFLAVDVTLHYDSLLNMPIKGYMKFESVRHDSIVKPKFPVFTSYRADQKVALTNDPAVNFTGGFSLNGANPGTRNLFDYPSRVEILGNPGKKVEFRSRDFEFGDTVLRAPNARMVIHHKSDSIFHPSVRFSYYYGSKDLRVTKERGKFKDTPFISSFFGMNIKTEDLYWNMGGDSLDLNIRNGKTIVPTVFESFNHFERTDFFKLRGLYSFNPLLQLVNYSKRIMSDRFFLGDMASDTKINYEMLEGGTQMLHYKGLLSYDRASGQVILYPNAIDMVDANMGKVDYDDIILESIMSEDRYSPNATVYLEDERIEVRGVETFGVSDSLNVNIFPDSSRITILKNRDIKFDGIITAGNFEYVGKDFTFKYDSFLVNLGVIESVQFYVTDSLGNRSQIDNRMVGLDSAAAAVAGVSAADNATSGTLYINAPDNKSAKIEYPNYPNFNAGMGAVVYFDRPEILDGIYDKSIFFVAPPFKIDSLNDSDPAAIQFEGAFASSGMFPVFEEKLERQPDNSMGFVHDIPEEGYQLYQGEGTMQGGLSLNKEGLRGQGKIDFLTTTLLSDDFTFYPDSITGYGQSGQMLEEDYNGLVYPAADFSNYRLKWLPKKDSMYIYNVGDPFQFYNGVASLDGVAAITNLGVRGKGTLRSLGSVAESDRIILNSDNFTARNSEFIVESDDPTKPTLAGTDVRLDFNLLENYATIGPEVVGDDAITFPYAQFKTSIPTARWDLADQKIYMEKPEEVAIEDSYFYTTRNDLDSLSFSGTSAVYDIQSLELKVSGIPYIEVADARIIPENNEVLVLENSTIGTLKNTVVLLDRFDFYHRLYDGVITVISRNEFSGYATYELINAVQDTFAIQMTDFRLEEFIDESNRRAVPEMHTVANGTVVENDRILMSPGMFYKGDVKLEAHNPALKLSGYIKLNLTKIPNYNTWIRYSSDATQETIVLDFDNALTEGGKVVSAGLYFDSEDNDLYSIFVDDPHFLEDEIFFRPSGELFYDEDSARFVIEDPLKASGENFSGKLFTYDEATSDISFEGPVQFFPPTKQADILASMIGTGRLDSSNFDFNTFLAIDFDIDNRIWDIMAYNLQDIIQNLGAPDGYGDPTSLLYKVAEIIGERAAKDYEERTLQEFIPLAGFTKETARPLVFPDVELKWSSEHKAFYSEGLLGMAGVKGYDVNGAWEGFMEIKKNEDGSPVFNLFFKAAFDSWYYISYEDNRLLLFSSLVEFNDEVAKRSNAAKAKIGDLIFIMGDRAETQNYVDNFRLKYYGIDEPYVLDAEADLDEEGKKKKGTKADDGF